jgi:hypothetical protein
MSHVFSSLAVQDITDESAAVHSGGVLFQGFLGATGTGAGPVKRVFSANAVVGDPVKDYMFTADSPDGNLLPFDNLIKGFKIDEVEPAREYSAIFYDKNNFSGAAKVLRFSNRTSQSGFRTINAPFGISSILIRRTF